MSDSDLRFKYSIDRGGTFTDVFCEVYQGGKLYKSTVTKLLSEDPSNYKDAPTEGIRRILEDVTGIPHPRSERVDTSRIEHIRMGTTVATNALLERRGDRCALITTKGFKDLQYIGNQSRPKIFDLEIRRPEGLYECVYEVNERVVLLKDSESEYQSSIVEDASKKDRVCVGLAHDKLFVEQPLDMVEVREMLLDIKNKGINSLAIVLLHSYTFNKHELMIKEVAEELNFEQVSCSSDVMAMVRMVPRGCTTCVDAYLTPVIKRYLDGFCSGFDSELLNRVQVSFMQSDGGLTPLNSFLGNRAILSGPAGGVVGYARTSYDQAQGLETTPMPVIGFDMGGTSTDVSRYAGEYEHVFETTTAGVTIQSPQLDINTVAAGGGSRLFYRNGLFVVGPESSGAHPGPVCYRKKGGLLAITDANVCLGRIQPHLFPAIFGESENEVLDHSATKKAFDDITQLVNNDIILAANAAGNVSPKLYTTDEVAYGFIRIANEAMARPIRNLTTMKGYDVTRHALSCFGGAGPQHCCAIAKSLGMKKIYVHRYSGILSAFGLSLADIVVERQIPFGSALTPDSMAMITEELLKLRVDAAQNLTSQKFSKESMQFTSYLNCRYAGTDTTIMTSINENGCNSTADLVHAYEVAFRNIYMREYGFELTNRHVIVDDIRVRAVGKASNSFTQEQEADSLALETNANHVSVTDPVPSEKVDVYFENGRCSTNVYKAQELAPFTTINGPAIIVQNVATVVVEPGCTAHITKWGDIEITVEEVVDKKVTTTLDPIYLSIFSHRFMGIAEQMGRTLQRTSISVNIKERLDFSCALFDPSGGLVANAPHLPVHLGAMSDAVKHQVKYWGYDNLFEGDVLVSNHPQLAGGSHLPDITVITPIFSKETGKITFFVASRGHHADVGGVAPGSMPPMSKTLEDEGAAITAFKLVRKGEFDEEGITKLLMAPGLLPNNFGTRNLSENISDLKAQVAANHKGATLMLDLVHEYSFEVVQAYMMHIQNCAEQAVRSMLRKFSIDQKLPEIGSVYAQDFLDDGSPIKLKVTIDRSNEKTGTSATFDFTGTGPEVYGNWNAPPAVTASAVIYCLRCLLDSSDIPLNQGCLAPINIIIPKGCFLNPSAHAAVVGGNVLTSQRVTDVVLLAFQACAASQGCMNNLTFGDDTMGYYETIAGGAGAGPTWEGCSGVHTHMTNTRITDPEILEKRYPVVLRQFALREHSGGSGLHKGGEGVVRELEFTRVSCGEF